MPPTLVPHATPSRAQQVLTFTEHLEELRRRLGICLLAVLAGAVISWRFGDRVLLWLRRPAGELLPRFAFFSPTEAFAAYMKLAVACGVALAMPVILYQLWSFVRTALTWRERAYALAFGIWGTVLFVLGAWFAYAWCLPLFLKFLLGIGQPYLEPVISITRYLSFVLGMLVTCGVLFEMPLVIFMLARLGILAPDALQRHRAAALLVLLVVAAIVTPTTDAVSLLVLTAPLLVLYEVSILVARLASR